MCAPIFQSWSEGWKRPMSQFKQRDKRSSLLFKKRSAFLFPVGLRLHEAHNVREGNLLYSVTDSDVNIIQKHSHRHTQSNVWSNVRCPIAQSSRHIKSTITHTLMEAPQFGAVPAQYSRSACCVAASGATLIPWQCQIFLLPMGAVHCDACCLGQLSAPGVELCD